MALQNASTQTRVRQPRVYLAKIWQNQTKSGKTVLRLTFDKAFHGQTIVIGENTIMEFWANQKREGKKDADFRGYITEPEGDVNGLTNEQ